MSRLIVAMQTSIDGYVDSSVPDSRWQQWGWGPDWPWSADLRADYNALFAGTSGILLSRPMVDEGYLGHWSRMAALHPADADWEFSRRIGELPKFVACRADLPAREWPRTAVLTGGLRETVPKALEAAGGDVLCFGGAGFVAALLEADLVDELRLFTNPGFAGAGRSVFGPTLASRVFRATAATTYDCGIAQLAFSRR
ncbi:dihydrofolate reductase family protein [Kitasatospora sp. NPDC101183]|uniref:dihydrofolate reductase family protein n=1 Tax=Kitasatospora sp. NPDC101183 TaxID=3364100 RepID=UPI003829102E